MKKNETHIHRWSINWDTEERSISAIVIGILLVLLAVVIPVTLYCITAFQQ